MGGKRVER